MNCLKQECGSILVLCVLLLPIMFGCLGFAYDFGNLYMHRARLQNVADAAALAGARAYLDNQADTTIEDKDKDKIDGTVNLQANNQLTADSVDKIGRDEYEYVPTSNPATRDHGNSKHHVADRAADAYIYKNIINLGNKVKSDKWSHYAINSTDGKTFYRIGLSEEVPLYFLPIIKKIKSPQTVRVGAVVKVVPGETKVIEGGGGTGSESGVTSPSIFDNLFTFSEWLFTRNLTLNDGTVEASFTGTMVYTHLNNTDDAPSSIYYKDDLQPNAFFHYESDNGSASDEFQYTHMYENAIGTNVDTTAGTINDPYIDTFYDTKAYLEAFRSKLDGDYLEVVQLDSSVELKASDINDGSSSLYHRNGELVIDGNKVHKKQGTSDFLYVPNGGDYYLVNIETNDYLTLQEGDKSYKVCYHELPGTNQLYKCVKVDSKYYLLNDSNQITNFFIDGSELYITINGETKQACYNNPKFVFKNNLNEAISTDQITHNKYPLAPELANNYFQLQNDPIYVGDITFAKSNVLHVPLNWKTTAVGAGTQTHDTLEIIMDEALTGDNINEPLYILVEGIEQVKITGSGNMTEGRPVIIVLLSEDTGKLKYEFTGDFKGTIYAPISTFEHVKGSGTFTGNIIAKTINVQASTQITWVQENHLEKYEKNSDGTYKLDANGNKIPIFVDNSIKDVSDATKDRIEQAMQEVNLTDAQKKEIYTKLGLSEAEMAAMASNPNWYNEQTFGRKKTLYQKWRKLYDETPANSPLRNFLWPWNKNFDIEGGEDQIITTGEELRLINYRTEYRTGDTIDPFVYLSLGDGITSY